MRFLFIILLTSPVSAQFLDIYKDSAVVETIALPKNEPFDTSRQYAHMEQEYVYICSNSDMYDIFGYSIASKYRDFDFSETHILGIRKCKDIKVNGACAYEWTWLVRDNKTAFTEIPISLTPGHIGTDVPERGFVKDTVMYSFNSNGNAKWFTNANGDCFASFNYHLYADKYHPVLLLREWNHWGGCRAGGYFDFTLSFDMPPGIKYKLKSITLSEK